MDLDNGYTYVSFEIREKKILAESERNWFSSAFCLMSMLYNWASAQQKISYVGCRLYYLRYHEHQPISHKKSKIYR